MAGTRSDLGLQTAQYFDQRRHRAWLLNGGMNIAREADDFSQVFSERIAPLMPVVEHHPDFPTGTLLYFIDPPMYSLQVAGLFLHYYGRAVNVGSTDNATHAGLHTYSSGYVFFFDNAGRIQEQPVGVENLTPTQPSLPANFDMLTRLEGYELGSTTIKRGDAIVLLLYWRAMQKIDTNYTVFVHLVDANGQNIEGFDSEPQGGRVPTSLWKPNQMVISFAVIKIPPDTLLANDYPLEVGLYDLRTMQRLSVVDAQGHPIADKVIIESLGIVE